MAATLRNVALARWLLGSVLGTVLVATVLWYVGSRYDWVEYSFHTGMTGEARRNPLHAAQLLFDRLGMPARKVEDLRALFELSPTATVVLWSARALDPDQAERLAQWVKHGGHLVVDGDSRVLNRRLGLRGIGRYRPAKSDQPPVRITLDGHTLAAKILYASLFDSEHPLRYSATVAGGDLSWFEPREEKCGCPSGEEGGVAHEAPAGADTGPANAERPAEDARVLVHYALGRGYVTAFGDISIFDNARIAEHDHAELLVRLVRLGRAGPIHLAPDPHFPSLLAWLLANAWSALLAALVLLGAWLWRAMPRFGPAETLPPAARPGLLEHLTAVAEFHLKARHFAALLAALQEDCLRALQLGAVRDGADAAPVLHAHRLTGLPAADIETALRATPWQRHEFVRCAWTLSRIRDALTPARSHFNSGPQP